MNKSFLKGVFLTLGILSLFGIVFAVGLHTANEITSGTFSGNYNFNGNVDFTNATIVGNGSSSMVTDWPDAIKCNSGSGHRILNYVYESDSSGLHGYRQANSIEVKIVFNPDGSYNSHDEMTGYDCLGKSIQQLYDNGQAFNLVGGFDNHKINCPTGFTSVESNGRQLGCIQNDEEGSANCMNAMYDCWNTYGGRLPSVNELYISFEDYALIDENDDNEWADGGSYTKSDSTRRCSVLTLDWEASSNPVSSSRAYRCFIPN